MVAVEVADRLQDITVGIAEALPQRRRVVGEDRHLVARIGADAPLEAFYRVCWENGLGRDWMTRHAPAARVACQVNTALGMEEAVRAGIGYLAAFGADGDPVFRRLRPTAEDLALDIWPLIHPDLRRNARIRAFTDFMAAALTERRDHIEGRFRQ